MQQQSVKVLIADDHELIRGGLRQVLQLEAPLRYLRQADGEAAPGAYPPRKNRILAPCWTLKCRASPVSKVARRVQSEGLPTHVNYF